MPVYGDPPDSTVVEKGRGLSFSTIVDNSTVVENLRADSHAGPNEDGAVPHSAIVHASGMRARTMCAARSNTAAARLRIPESLVAQTARASSFRRAAIAPSGDGTTSTSAAGTTSRTRRARSRSGAAAGRGSSGPTRDRAPRAHRAGAAAPLPCARRPLRHRGGGDHRAGNPRGRSRGRRRPRCHGRWSSGWTAG